MQTLHQMPVPGQPVNITTLENFFPGYFALVMATGIVSIGLQLWGYHVPAISLLAANVCFFIILLLILFLRIYRYPQIVWSDLHHPARGVTFLTLVAGTNILGSQLVIILNRADWALYVWITGFVLWALLLYTFFLFNILKEPKPVFEQSISGAWLLIVVSTESVAVLGALIAVHSSYIAFIALCTYMIGGMLYLVLIGLIFYRWLFISMKAELLTPPYWINMGAVAITALAGSRLVMFGRSHPGLEHWTYFVETFTLFFWAFASWWVPLLFLLFFYRHFIARVPLQYDPQYWSMVFPLGMYGVCTFNYAKITGFAFLLPVSHLFVFIGAVTWIIVGIGLIIELVKRVKVNNSAQQVFRNNV
ncbi:tellurite resistance/C4-dicarboxylate transporter family protein [Chitinophaga agrisoli]|nr:tellurite resistance/C4-dicarboxylate transporter family protein [Chitinophaga agrisoli]